MSEYAIYCECKAVQASLSGSPIVHACCHCTDCRELLDIPFHSVTAWKPDSLTFVSGKDKLIAYQHPTLKMQKHFCFTCGEVLFNTNGMDWRIVSQLLIAKCNAGKLPDELRSDKHFFYEQRVVDVSDDLPKYLRGTNGPLFEG